MSEEKVDQDDPAAEVAAMSALISALSPLNLQAKVRVLRWATETFGVSGAVSTSNPGSRTLTAAVRPETGMTPLNPHRNSGEFGELADLYSATNPESDVEKALVVAYWLQVVKGDSDVDTQSVNTELKHLGFGIGNITRAFDRLKSTRPNLVIQLRKEGSHKQSRKRFKVTVEGQREVERMLAVQSGS
jgi:hypothetical protein